MCDCYICIRTRKLLSLAKTEEDKTFIDEVLTDLEAAETDAVYWKMKYKDEWPNQGGYVHIPIGKKK